MSEEERKLVEKNIVLEATLVEITPELMKKTIVKQDKEIERLKNINEEHRILNGELRKELQQKENIIKEVREYIEKCQLGVNTKGRPLMLKNEIEGEELLEILDKAGDNNE